MTDGGLRVLAGVFWGFMLRCGSRYEGDFSEHTQGAGCAKGSGKFTSGYGGWTYLSGKKARFFPGMSGCIFSREGELVEADGHHFKVTFANGGCFLLGRPGATFPTPTTKVLVVCGAAGQELLAVRTRACGAAGMCGAGHCVGMLVLLWACCARRACVGTEGLLTLLS